jgi:hypothetical protein
MSFSNDEQEMLRKAVDKNFGDLTAQGFTIGRVGTKIDPLMGEQLLVEVGVPDVGRGIRITLFHTPNGHRKELAAFLHKGGTGGFMVETYLKLKGAPADVVQQLSLSTHQGDLSDRVDAVLGLIRAVVDRQLLPALLDGEWPIVPVDWGDYR